jgi:hypothetical protein
MPHPRSQRRPSSTYLRLSPNPRSHAYSELRTLGFGAQQEVRNTLSSGRARERGMGVRHVSLHPTLFRINRRLAVGGEVAHHLVGLTKLLRHHQHRPSTLSSRTFRIDGVYSRPTKSAGLARHLNLCRIHYPLDASSKSSISRTRVKVAGMDDGNTTRGAW